ncbi:MAG: LLM class flavin-dependent oxidoreductase, partial [Candidatus Binataceae bacterium]
VKSEHQVLAEQLETLRAGEDMGFDSIWVPEHHFTEYGFSASPMLMLAAVASVTNRVRLGSGVVVLPFNDPVRIAEEGAMVDLLSDGRLELGVGRGFQPVEFHGFGVDPTQSEEIFDEALEIILRAWTAETVAFKGHHFKVAEHAVRPKPLQKPHPPIWVAALNTPSFEIAGRGGHNLLYSLVPGFQHSMVADHLETYRRALRTSGYNPRDREIGALCMIHCAETTERARKEFADPVLWYFRTIAKYVAPAPGQVAIESYETYPDIRRFARHVEWDELLKRGTVICGNPETCIRQIEDLRSRYGFTQLLCWTRLTGLEHRKVLGGMELFARHVLPHFHRAAPPKGAH